jgi:hypothetical protein
VLSVSAAYDRVTRDERATTRRAKIAGMFRAGVLAVILSTAAVSQAGVAHAAVAWGAALAAPSGAGAIHPGVQTFTDGAQCTANFVFSDGINTFLGQAAHCATQSAATQTNGCTTPSKPLGTPVTISGASRPGVLAYSSWLTMQRVHETDANACAYNDLALVRIDPADVPRVSPTMPVWGGPSGLNVTGLPSGSAVYSYGNSVLRLGLTLLSPKVGVAEGEIGGGWSHVVTTITPGIPGDSGSAFLDSSGNAVGDLVTIGIGIPGGVTNEVSDLNHELNYLNGHARTNVGLVLSGVPFNRSAAPLDATHPVTDPLGSLRTFAGI